MKKRTPICLGIPLKIPHIQTVSNLQPPSCPPALYPSFLKHLSINILNLAHWFQFFHVFPLSSHFPMFFWTTPGSPSKVPWVHFPHVMDDGSSSKFPCLRHSSVLLQCHLLTWQHGAVARFGGGIFRVFPRGFYVLSRSRYYNVWLMFVMYVRTGITMDI